MSNTKPETTVFSFQQLNSFVDFERIDFFHFEKRSKAHLTYREEI